MKLSGQQPTLPLQINSPFESFLWYLFGNGESARMGEGYLSAFRNSKAYDEMIEEIESCGLKWAKAYNYQGGKRWIYTHFWYDVLTVELMYDPLYNFTFGTIQEVKAVVSYEIVYELEYHEDHYEAWPYVHYNAQFYLKDNYNFEGDNNIILRYPFGLHKWGTPYDVTGSFVVRGRVTCPRPLDRKEE